MKNDLKYSVSHEGKEVAFANSAIDGFWEYVPEQMRDVDLREPRSSEISSLVYGVHQGLGKGDITKIFNVFKNGKQLWEFTGNLYLPKSNDEVNNGVILDLNPTIENSWGARYEGRNLIMDKVSLVERLNEGDPNIKFVPFGYKVGEQSVSELEKNTYVVVRYGEEGAEKIAKVASEYGKKPFLLGRNYTDIETDDVSALGDERLSNDTLVVSAISFPCRSFGYGFGVVEENEKY